MLEEHIRGMLNQNNFPFTKPHLDATEGLLGQDNVSQASLRSTAKPTWARTRPSAMEPRQRIIVFMAGGATYSESRACYEISQAFNKDVFLATSHMLTPSLFLRQVGDLSVDRRRLGLPAERPKPQAPAHLFEREPQPSPRPSHEPDLRNAGPQQPPVASTGVMNLGPHHGNAVSSNRALKPQNVTPPTLTPLLPSGKLSKKDKEKDSEKKKKHHFFSSKK